MLNNLYHLSWVRTIRSIARKTGVLGLIKKIMSLREHEYEEAFHASLKVATSPGDVVWDVGANIGIYTEHFLEWAGSTGRVIAFEPLPQAFAALEKKFSQHPLKQNVKLVRAALADKTGEAIFSADIENNSVTTTAHIKDAAARTSAADIRVALTTADYEVQNNRTQQPNVVKIDVEGFEEDVLRGGEKTFSSKACKHILVEMHFTRMDERKLGDSAQRIVQMLKKWEYTVNWVDPSHIHASRAN